MAGEREIGEETRNQMMQNLFGDQSEEEEEDEIEEPSTPHRPYYHSDEEGEGEVEVDIEGQGEVEDGSEGEQHDLGDRRHSQDHDQGEESEAERNQTSPERENITSDHKLESEVKDAVETGEEEEEEEDEDDDEDDQGGYGQRVVTSRRREVLSSESEERSKDSNRYINDNEDEEVYQDRKPGSPSDGEDHAIVRDVFGDSEDDEPAEYEVQNEHEQDSHVRMQERSDVGEDEFYKKNLRPEDIVPDEDGHYDSEDENIEQKTKEKAVGPPLDLDIPMCRPPSQPNKMNMIRVSNIMGVEPKPFDPKTYVEEDVFVTDESGGKKRIRLEDNIVRWRKVRNRDGTFSLESNARFVRWSDGSLQLLIGNEVLDISVQEAQHDHTHLFLRHEKGVLQSQGRLLRKMRFMPSSLSSKSHRLLTALVDSRHKKVYKVKNCITDIDPEREKEEKERAEGQTIRANTLLQRKREKVSKKYNQSVDRSRQLSPGFLEEALDEDDEHEDYYSTHRSTARRRFDEDMEIESQAERRIINSKKSNASQRALPRGGSLSSQHPSRSHLEEYSDNDKEESEYESDGDFRESPARGTPESDHEDEYDEEEEAEDEIKGTNKSSDDEEEKIRPKGKDVEGSSRKRKEIESDVESPPRKPASHRRMAIVFDSDED